MLAAFLLMLFATAAEPSAPPAGSSIQMLFSPDVPASMDQARADLALRLVARHTGQAEKLSPRIVVLFASRAAADLEGLPTKAPITVARMEFQSLPLYHVWIVGPPNEDKLVYAFLHVVNTEWKLSLTEKQIAALQDKVCGEMAATISVQALQRR